jgi:hypothetical protein
MDTQSIGEAIKTAAEIIRKFPPVRRRKNVSHALAVKSGYVEIQKLREEGYSYDVICGEFAGKGVLPSGASPKNLCSAFLRETKRRGAKALAINEATCGEVTKTSAGDLVSANVEARKPVTPSAPAFPDRWEPAFNSGNAFNIWPHSLSKSDIEETYDSGRGFKITKHSDDSFDYE